MKFDSHLKHEEDKSSIFVLRRSKRSISLDSIKYKFSSGLTSEDDSKLPFFDNED